MFDKLNDKKGQIVCSDFNIDLLNLNELKRTTDFIKTINCVFLVE